MKGRYGMTTSNLQMPDGILLIDKPSGMTSHDVVFRVRRLMGTKKVGHTGTLDPMATGVLVVLVGRAAKAAEYVSHDEKTYEATLRIGMTTEAPPTRQAGCQVRRCTSPLQGRDPTGAAHV